MYLGIDFGTSFSQVSTILHDLPVLLMDQGEYGVPSSFYYDQTYGALVGQDALDYGQGYAALNLVREVKMSIIDGKKFSLDGRVFTTQEIVREIYKCLVSKAIKNAKIRGISPTIDGIVVSVPVKFGLQEKDLISNAVKSCLENQTLPVRAIIKEPVAAALSYYKTSAEDEKTILVYDLGGGTCDIAVVKANSNIREHYEVIDQEMLRIGGRDWDNALCDYLTEIFEYRYSLHIKGNAGIREKIRRAAVSAKHALSDLSRDTVMARVEINGRVYAESISRHLFDELTISLLGQTMDCLEDVYDRNSSEMNISDIICVGGSSNMPQIERELKKRFPKCNIRLHQPELAVVNGAAYFANMKNVQLIDRASFSYGVLIHSNSDDCKIENLIMKDAKLPAAAHSNFFPLEDHQKTALFQIFESSQTEKIFDYNGSVPTRHVGNMRLYLPMWASKHTKINCTMNLNSDGLLEIHAGTFLGRKIKAEFQIEKI